MLRLIHVSKIGFTWESWNNKGISYEIDTPISLWFYLSINESNMIFTKFRQVCFTGIGTILKNIGNTGYYDKVNMTTRPKPYEYILKCILPPLQEL